MAGPPAGTPGIAGGRLTDLEALAAELSGHLVANRRPGVTERMAADATLLKVIEETGELAGAHSRLRGTSRRRGTRRELEGETVDVLLSVAVYAVQSGAGETLRGWHPGSGPPGAAPGGPGDQTADTAAIALARAVFRLADAHDAPPGAGGAGLPLVVAGALSAVMDYAAAAGIDLNAAVTRKIGEILSRGWREEQDTA